MTYVQIFPLVTVVVGIFATGLGVFMLVKEHHAAPIMQRACTGVLMFALAFTIFEAWECAKFHRPLDWRLMLFTIGLAGAWIFRLRHARPPETPKAPEAS